MAVLIITAKYSFLPDPDDPAGWEIHSENNIDFYFKEVACHKLFLKECIQKTNLKQKSKHEETADFVKLVKSKTTNIMDDEYFLIVHDSDLKKSKQHDEGLYSEDSIKEVGSSLQSLIPDKHVYVFQHSEQHDMFEILIKNILYGIDEDIVNRVVEYINSCQDTTTT